MVVDRIGREEAREWTMGIDGLDDAKFLRDGRGARLGENDTSPGHGTGLTTGAPAQQPGAAEPGEQRESALNGWVERGG